MLLWLFFISVEMWSDTTTEYGSRMYPPATALMLGTIALPLTRLGALVLIFFGAELVWRARAHAMDEILNADTGLTGGVLPRPPRGTDDARRGDGGECGPHRGRHPAAAGVSRADAAGVLPRSSGLRWCRS
jgi:hypothetical protein